MSELSRPRWRAPHPRLQRTQWSSKLLRMASLSCSALAQQVQQRMDILPSGKSSPMAGSMTWMMSVPQKQHRPLPRRRSTRTKVKRVMGRSQGRFQSPRLGKEGSNSLLGVVREGRGGRAAREAEHNSWDCPTHRPENSLIQPLQHPRPNKPTRHHYHTHRVHLRQVSVRDGGQGTWMAGGLLMHRPSTEGMSTMWPACLNTVRIQTLVLAMGEREVASSSPQAIVNLATRARTTSLTAQGTMSGEPIKGITGNFMADISTAMGGKVNGGQRGGTRITIVLETIVREVAMLAHSTLHISPIVEPVCQCFRS